MQLVWYPADGSSPITFPGTLAGNDGDIVMSSMMNHVGFAGAPVTHQTLKSPNQDGVSYLWTVYEPRVISFDVMVQTASLQDLLDTQGMLTGMFDASKGIGSLVWIQQNGKQYLLKCIANGNCPSNPADPQNRGPQHQRYTFPMIAHDPFWYSGSAHVVYFAFIGKSFFPFNFPFNFQSPHSPTQNLINQGSAKTPVYVLFTGPMTNPVLTNSLTGKTLGITLVLAAGETFEVNTDKNDIYATYHSLGGNLNGNPYLNNMVTLAEFLLEAGDNPVTLSSSSSGSGAQAMIQWSDKYVGV
jgi:hypothetical protein